MMLGLSRFSEKNGSEQTMSIHKLASNIKYYRTNLNWTQQQLADKLKISRSVVAKWENGDVLPDLPAIIKLSHIFHQSIDSLLGLNKHADQLLSDFQQFYQTNAEDQQAIDETFLDLISFFIKNPQYRDQLIQISKMPIKHQKAIQRMIATMINEIDKL